MTAKIVANRFADDQPLNPDALLESLKGTLESFVLCGYDYDGEECFVSTYVDGGDVLWLLERCKHKVVDRGQV